MSIGGIGPNKRPEDISNNESSGDKKSTEKTKRTFFTKLRESSTSKEKKNVGSLEGRVKHGHSKSGSLLEKSQGLSKSAKELSENAGKLEETYRRETDSSFSSKISNTFINLFSKRSSKTHKEKKREDSSEKRVKTSQKTDKLLAKSQGLSKSAKELSENAGKLEEKYRRQAESSIFKDIEMSVRNFFGLSIKTHAESKSQDISSEDVIEESSDSETKEIIEAAVNIEAAGCCVDDCNKCCRALRALYKKCSINNETSKKIGRKIGYETSDYKNIFFSSVFKVLHVIRQLIVRAQDSLRARRMKMYKTFSQRVILILSERGSPERRAQVKLASFLVFAKRCGYTASISENGLSIEVKSLSEFKLEKSFNLLLGYVEEITEEIEIKPLSEEERQILENEIVQTTNELNTCCNVLKYLVGKFD